MKKRFNIVFVFVSILLLAFAVTVSADSPAPGGPFATAFRVQNLSATNNATCQFQFYAADGTLADSFATSSPIAPGDSYLVYTPSVTTLASGEYSGVVSCDQEVAAVVNFSDADSGASHSGIAGTATATTWYAPGVYNNFYSFYSNVYVQNTTSSPIDITLSLYEAGNTTPVSVETATAVPAFSSVSFDQSTNTNLSTNVSYSAIVQGTGAIAPIVNIYGLGSANNQLYSYNAFTSGATTAYAPVIMNNYFGYNTALTVQNIDVSTAEVTVTYGTGETQTASIASGASALFYTPTSGIASGVLTGAVVNSTNGMDIVATVNESNGYNRAASYTAFANGSTSVNIPIIMKRYYNYNSSVTCQNVGNNPATIQIDYSDSNSETSGSVAVGATTLFYQPAVAGMADNFIGSATITSAEPVVCVVNQDINEGSGATTSWDQLFAYEGIQ